jgi:hypothetical protein
MKVAIIGGGPAGLMAAESAIAGGARVDLYDAMPSPARKFLLAGKGGLNLTHSEPSEPFLARYGARRAQIEPLLAAFGPHALREWARGLGVETFVGTSGRVFPSDLKAAPLLRAWLRRLRHAGVTFHIRHRWTGWDIAGPAGTSTGLCVLLPLRAAFWSMPTRWFWRWVVGVGLGSAPMAPGCRCSQAAVFPLNRYDLQTAASMWDGASTFARGMPGTL